MRDGLHALVRWVKAALYRDIRAGMHPGCEVLVQVRRERLPCYVNTEIAVDGCDDTWKVVWSPTLSLVVWREDGVLGTLKAMNIHQMDQSWMCVHERKSQARSTGARSAKTWPT